MQMGGNITLSSATLLATLSWDPRPGVPAVDASALLLDERGVVGSEADFVFYNQPQHPSGAVVLSSTTPGANTLDIDLARIPAATTRVVLAASADGGTFGQVPALRIELADRAAAGALVAAFAMHAADETAFLAAEIYRRGGQWKFRAVGQGYSTGLAGLARDFGIDVTGSDAPASPPPPAPAAPSAPAAPPAPPAPPEPAAPPAPARQDREPGYDPLLDLG
ncbi:MAG: TerD family protein [Jatrophihabitans endophyticus]|nr:TerD family protein [Jatrophihabitans endophyticus]